MLHDLQATFAAAVITGDVEAGLSLCEGDAHRIARGLRVYANNAAHAIVSAARDAFPQTQALCGAEAFTALVLHYARTERPEARILGEALLAFPAFLGTLDGLDERAADCARFESLWLSSYHAADAAALELDRLAMLDGETFATARLCFHPSLRLYRPGAAQADHQGDAWSFLAHPHVFLRPADTVRTIRIDAPASQVLDVLMSGRSVAEALAPCAKPDAVLDDLGALIAAGALTAISVEDPLP